jgi:hypothetical protein
MSPARAAAARQRRERGDREGREHSRSAGEHDVGAHVRVDVGDAVERHCACGIGAVDGRAGARDLRARLGLDEGRDAVPDVAREPGEEHRQPRAVLRRQAPGDLGREAVLQELHHAREPERAAHRPHRAATAARARDEAADVLGAQERVAAAVRRVGHEVLLAEAEDDVPREVALLAVDAELGQVDHRPHDVGAGHDAKIEQLGRARAVDDGHADVLMDRRQRHAPAHARGAREVVGGRQRDREVARPGSEHRHDGVPRSDDGHRRERPRALDVDEALRAGRRRLRLVGDDRDDRALHGSPRALIDDDDAHALCGDGLEHSKRRPFTRDGGCVDG